jgi:hypothetical protein
MGHGYPSENTDRETAMGAAQSAAVDCIRCRALLVNDEVGVHILWMRSPVDNKHKLGKQNWHQRAKAKGVTRWQFAIESPAHVDPESIHVLLHEMTAVGPRGESAVIAAAGAERDVEVNPERHQSGR